MVGGDDHTAAGRDIFYADKLDLPAQPAKETNNRPDYLKGPLRQHCACACTCNRAATRRCAVDAQGKLSDKLGLSLLTLNLIPPVGGVLLRQAIFIPTFARVTLETFIGESFALGKTDEIPLLTITEATPTGDVKKQHLFGNSNFPKRLHHSILQRPFLIDELDMNSWYSICSSVSRPYYCVRRQIKLLTCQTNKTTSRNR